MTDMETHYFRSLDCMPVGSFVLRKDYVVLFWNQCLENWTGIRRHKIVGTNIAEHFPHFREYEGRLESIFEGGQPTVFSSQPHGHIIPSTLPNGQPRIQHTTVTAMRAITGDGFYAIFSIEDVTDMSRRVRDYALVSKKLKESNEELEAFTYSVSHDLRAPLRAMMAFSKVLTQKFADKLPEQVCRYLKIINDSALELSHLIDDLLRLSRISRADFKRETINMEELAQQTFNELADQCQGRNVSLVLGDLPECLGDPTLIKQLLTNLIGNSFKYTRCRDAARIEVGSVTPNITRHFFVKDNGAGFDMKHADRLFGVFQRLHRPEEYEGTGVGLAIVKRIVDRHGGRVWAEGKTDNGATVWFTLGEDDAR